jgi:hypothetical protein
MNKGLGSHLTRTLRVVCGIVLGVSLLNDSRPHFAAQRGGRGQGGALVSAQASAPLDLTGQWVSLVSDDWRWRMVSPPKGDVLYLPVNEAGRKVAEQWDPAKDQAAGEACKAYGAGGIMHWPGRLRISWDNENTLKLETDTGQQTRVFNFGNAQPPSADPGWQGFSVAAWELPGGGRGRRGGGAGTEGGSALRAGSSMRVTTTRMRPGYYRRNGVPYGTYLLVTKILEDAQYLNGPYVRTVQFKKENGTAGWNPTPCVVP